MCHGRSGKENRNDKTDNRLGGSKRPYKAIPIREKVGWDILMRGIRREVLKLEISAVSKCINMLF